MLFNHIHGTIIALYLYTIRRKSGNSYGQNETGYILSKSIAGKGTEHGCLDKIHR